MPTTVLFCADPFSGRRVDDHFAREAAAVRDLGGAVALIDDDLRVRGDAAPGARVIYRGWMLTATRYAALAATLAARDMTLLTSPTAYAAAHELPGWYAAFAAPIPSSSQSSPPWPPASLRKIADLGAPGPTDPPPGKIADLGAPEPTDPTPTPSKIADLGVDGTTGLTPTSVWWPAAPGAVPTPAELGELVAPLGAGAGIVKDYVKSRKHEWAAACFVPDLRDLAGLHRVVAEMIRLQADDLYGGVVVRRFEEFAPGEVRVWWLGGAPVLVSPHPDAPAGTALDGADLAPVAAAVARLGAPFVTTDLARGERGWRVVEVGDAQVSDLHQDIPPIELWRPVLSAGLDRLSG